MLNFLQNLTNQQKIVIFGGAGAFILVLILVVGLMAGGKKTGDQDANYVTVFRQMEPMEAGVAAGKLKQEAKIDVHITEGGTAIAVPKDKLDAARIALANAGMPKSGVKGWEIFDKSSLVATDFDKKVAYNRAINGELVRLIKQIDGVDDAVVEVNMPEDMLFQSEKKPITAAVMVKMTSGRVLASSQVDGITHLVASSVPGLRTDNVTVADAEGNELTQGLEENAGDADSRRNMRAINQQMQVKRQMEADLENRLTSLLDPVVGQGKSKVRVNLDLDFNKREIVNKLLAPVVSSNGDPMDANKVSSSEAIKGGANGGQPGVASNLPTYPALPNPNSSGQSIDRKNQQDVTAFNQEASHITTASGNIKRMTIAVFVPDTIKPESVEKLKDMIADASGADASRRDHITIEPVRFDNSLLDHLKDELNKGNNPLKPKGKAVAWSLVWGVAGVMLAIFFILALIRRATRREENPFDALSQGLADDGALGGFDQASLSGMGMDPGGFGQLPGMGDFGGQFPGQFDPNMMGNPMMSAPGGDYGQPSYGTQPMGAEGGPFDFLYQQDPVQVAELLTQERPPTAAGILAQMDQGFAQQVLANMPQELQEDLYNRVNANPSLPAMTQRMVAQTLRRKLGVPA